MRHSVGKTIALVLLIHVFGIDWMGSERQPEPKK